MDGAGAVIATGVAPPGELTAVFARPVLRVDARAFSARDLLAAGVVSGRWQRLERELGDGLGLVGAAPPTAEEVDSEIRAFRHRHGLLSGEDMGSWLQARSLTLAAVRGAAARAVARSRGGTSVAVSKDEIAPLLPAEAIFRDVWRELGWWLADRWLAAQTATEEIEPLALQEALVKQLVFEEASTVAGATLGERGMERAHRLAWIAGLDRAHTRWERNATEERDLIRLLREHAVDWCRFELRQLRVKTPGAASEIARQLGDGVAADRVAAAAGVDVEAVAVVLEDAPEAMMLSLTGVVAGEVAGPWRDGDAHVVAYVCERVSPTLDDPELRTRARAELLVEATSRLRAGRITWDE